MHFLLVEVGSQIQFFSFLFAEREHIRRVVHAININTLLHEIQQDSSRSTANVQNRLTKFFDCGKIEETILRWQYSHFHPGTSLEDTIDRNEIIRDDKVIASEEHRQSPATRSYTQEQAVALYQNAGFKGIRVFHEFTFDPVKPEDRTFCVRGFRPE